MLRILFNTYFFTFLFTLPIILCAQQAKVEVNNLNNGIYKFTATTTFSVNLTASIGPDGVLLVDSGMKGAEELIQSELKKRSAGKIKYIINTHFHPDHFDGNKKLGMDALRIGHIKMRENLTGGLNILQEYGSDVLPQITFDKTLTIHFNGEDVQLTALPGTHSNADIIVYFPKSKVAAISSIVLKETFPYIGRRDGGSVLNYPEILDYLLNTFDKDVIFVSGHGENCTYTDIQNFKNMVDETVRLVKQGLAAGKNVEQMQKEKILGDWKSWAKGFVKTDMWIQTIATSLEPPKKIEQNESVAIPVFKMYRDKGITTAISEYKRLKKEQPETYDYREFGLNFFGYSLLNKEKYRDAIAIFKLNAKEFPESANVYDSLGEAYEKSGDLKSAEKNYARAVKNAKKTSDANLKIFIKNLSRVSK